MFEACRGPRGDAGARGLAAALRRRTEQCRTQRGWWVDATPLHALPPASGCYRERLFLVEFAANVSTPLLMM